MANTAEVINFPVPEAALKESRVADLDDGYTRIANELLDAVIGSGLTQNQLLITLAIIRKTYGYNKTSEWVSNAQLSELTGLPSTRCSTERNKLIKMGILTVNGRLTGINKNITEWNTDIHRISKTDITDPVNFTESVNFTETVNNSFTESVNQALQNLLNTKDNINNINNTPLNPPRGKPRFNPFSVELPEWLNPDAWHEWVSYRLQSGRPIKTGMTVTKAFSLLKQYLDEGCDPVDVINSSIANGYQGLFRPKYAPCKPVSAGKEQAGSHWNDRREWEENFI